jgi:hypothetical protein
VKFEWRLTISVLRNRAALSVKLEFKTDVFFLKVYRFLNFAHKEMFKPAKFQTPPSGKRTDPSPWKKSHFT